MSVIKERPRRYPETNLELIEESTSRDEILYQHAQLTTEQTVDRCHGGRGTDYVLKLGCDYWLTDLQGV